MSALTHDYFIDGMTCAHCVASVTEELSELDGVASVAVDLQAGGTSRASVVSAAALDEAAVRAAIEEAGYQLATSSR